MELGLKEDSDSDLHGQVRMEKKKLVPIQNLQKEKMKVQVARRTGLPKKARPRLIESIGDQSGSKADMNCMNKGVSTYEF